jgi:putative lipoic acid-binding regulatory protein
MNECRRPVIEYPCRVPLKVIGHASQLDAGMVAEVIQRHLGPLPEADRSPTNRRNGAYLSITFWVTLPDENAEGPLRAEIQKLPGVVMQL